LVTENFLNLKMNPCVDFSAGIVAVPREKDQGSNETIGAARVLNMTGGHWIINVSIVAEQMRELVM
jgi:hypothetical protein